MKIKIWFTEQIDLPWNFPFPKDLLSLLFRANNVIIDIFKNAITHAKIIIF